MMPYMKIYAATKDDVKGGFVRSTTTLPRSLRFNCHTDPINLLLRSGSRDDPQSGKN
jgi:hypothetical protein